VGLIIHAATQLKKITGLSIAGLSLDSFVPFVVKKKPTKRPVPGFERFTDQ
jgi:hypothetical protein